MSGRLTPEAHAERLARNKAQHAQELEWVSVVAAVKAGVWQGSSVTPPWLEFGRAKFDGGNVRDGWDFATWVLSRCAV